MFCRSYGQPVSFPKKYFKSLNQTHDIIDLPSWGPYSKKYAGISHIPDVKKGIRFDVAVLPGYSNGKLIIPDLLKKSLWYPWNINSDLSIISYRYESKWKDRVYTQLTYSTLDSSTVLVKMECENNTMTPQQMQLNLSSFIGYPESCPNVKAVYSDKIKFINAVSYQDLIFAKSRPSDDLVYNGWFRGEERNSNFLKGNGIGKRFGKDHGDKIKYIISLNNDQKEGLLTLRYKMRKGTQNKLITSGLTNKTILLKGTGKFEMVHVPYNSSKKKTELILQSTGGGEIVLDGMFVGSAEESKSIDIEPLYRNFTPKITKNIQKNSILLKYRDIQNYYGISWDYPDSCSFVTETSSINDNENNISKNKKESFVTVSLNPVKVTPMNSTIVYGIICSGSKENVSKQLSLFHSNPSSYISRNRTSNHFFEGDLENGKDYRFSQNMMKTVLLSNIVYPIYTQGNFIRHFTPGKKWNSLYTWDSGFLSLGLSEIDINKSVECLNAYTTPEDSQSAFIHHGSPVPIQIYAFDVLWNKTRSKDLLNYFYPRLKKYYEFMAGHTKSSTIGKLKSHLLKTWDYFYNSGGWDDYPAQVAVHSNNLEKNVSPVVTTAHMIRAAKIMRQAAIACGQKKDKKQYDEDIKTFTSALQNISWDKYAGYFSYIVHDSLGNPKKIYRNDNEINYNMGFDGVLPLFSGICTPEQEEILLDKLFSPQHMWTPAGICVVDQAAPYYDPKGYWNGSVWMPYQWLIWKSMLDLGRTDLAWKIAHCALELWKNETDSTYYTYENFVAATRKGKRWHQFSALSDPVLMWYTAYYKPGTVTTGFEIWLEQEDFNNDFSSYEAIMSFDDATAVHTRSMLICMNPDFHYKAFINGEGTSFESPYDGLITIKLPKTNKACKIKISRIDK